MYVILSFIIHIIFIHLIDRIKSLILLLDVYTFVEDLKM